MAGTVHAVAAARCGLRPAELCCSPAALPHHGAPRLHRPAPPPAGHRHRLCRGGGRSAVLPRVQRLRQRQRYRCGMPASRTAPAPAAARCSPLLPAPPAQALPGSTSAGLASIRTASPAAAGLQLPPWPPLWPRPPPRPLPPPPPAAPTTPRPSPAPWQRQWTPRSPPPPPPVRPPAAASRPLLPPALPTAAARPRLAPACPPHAWRFQTSACCAMLLALAGCLPHAASASAQGDSLSP